MFHQGTTQETKDRIIQNFKEVNSTIRMVVSTIAFGLGIDIPNVRSVIIWGLPDSLMDLWQLFGRGGRDGKQSYAMCYCFPRSLLCKHCRSGNCNCKYSNKSSIKSALAEKTCYRYSILKNFVLDKKMNAELSSVQESCETKSCETLCNCGACLCCTSCSASCKCVSKFQFQSYWCTTNSYFKTIFL